MAFAADVDEGSGVGVFNEATCGRRFGKVGPSDSVFAFSAASVSGGEPEFPTDKAEPAPGGGLVEAV